MNWIEFWGIVAGMMVANFLVSLIERLLGYRRYDERVRQLERKMAALRRLERRVDLLLQHAGIDPDTAPPSLGISPRTQALIDQGRTIEAIKAYRKENPGVSLREAKDVIDAAVAGKAW